MSTIRPASTESDALMEKATDDHNQTNHYDHHVAVEEYGSLSVAVVTDTDTDETMVIHDFHGPLLLETDTLERRESLFSELLSVDGGDREAMHLLPPHEPEDLGGQATVLSEIANLTKNLVGCGVLSLSGGISLCADSPSALWSANMWCILLGGVFGYFCFLIAKVCELTGRTTYRGIWTDTMGPNGAVAVSVANMLKAAMTNLAYATILADTLNSLFASIGLTAVPRIACLLLVTIFAIFPLCLLKDLHVLAPFSVIGTAGLIFTALAMIIRYLDGSYLQGGKFHDDIDPSYQPLFGTKNHALSTGILPFVCMLYEGYVMHYNAARFYTELKDRTLPRFAIAVIVSFALAALLSIAMADAGFLTFGANSASFILNNYSPNDPLATLSRIAIGISTLIAYAIVFHGVRDGVTDIMEVKIAEQTATDLNRLTLILLTILTVVAMFVTDLGLINAVGGGLVATAIVFVFPTLMYRSAVNFKLGGNHAEVGWASGLTALGILIGLIGSWLAVTGVTAT